jgi:hypothetical protein
LNVSNQLLSQTKLAEDVRFPMIENKNKTRTGSMYENETRTCLETNVLVTRRNCRLDVTTIFDQKTVPNVIIGRTWFVST